MATEAYRPSRIAGLATQASIEEEHHQKALINSVVLKFFSNSTGVAAYGDMIWVRITEAGPSEVVLIELHKVLDSYASQLFKEILYDIEASFDGYLSYENTGRTVAHIADFLFHKTTGKVYFNTNLKAFTMSLDTRKRLADNNAFYTQKIQVIEEILTVYKWYLSRSKLKEMV